VTLKLIVLAVITFVIWMASIAYTSYVMPGPVSDLAINQMERSDEAALALRATSQIMAWQLPIALGLWTVCALMLFCKDIMKGLVYVWNLTFEEFN